MITFMRHAQSQYNTREVKKNKDNVKLSNQGKKDCLLLNGNFDLVITSNTRRTIQTLKYSNIKFNFHIISINCKEIFFNFETNSIHYFKKELAKYSKKFKNILVISHRSYIKKLTGFNLTNLKTHSCKIEDII